MRRPVKFKSAPDWEHAYRLGGPDMARTPPAGARIPAMEAQEQRVRALVDRPSPLNFPAINPERQEAERRRRRVDRLLAKYGVGGPLPLWKRL